MEEEGTDLTFGVIIPIVIMIVITGDQSTNRRVMHKVSIKVIQLFNYRIA